MNHAVKFLLVTLSGFCLMGCAHYSTPGGRADLQAIANLTAPTARRADNGTGASPLQQALATKPTIEFPANLAVARLQAPRYRSFGATGVGMGRFTVVTTREIEKDEDFQAITLWPQVRGAAPVGRLLLPENMNSDEDLRVAAAKLHAHGLLLYTFETTFRDRDNSRLITSLSLGFAPSRQVVVNSTASAILLDVQTGFVYGTAESSASETARTSLWNSPEAADKARLKVERKAFDGLLSETAKMWTGVVASHRK